EIVRGALEGALAGRGGALELVHADIAAREVIPGGAAVLIDADHVARVGDDPSVQLDRDLFADRRLEHLVLGPLLVSGGLAHAGSFSAEGPRIGASSSSRARPGWVEHGSGGGQERA